MSMALFNQAGAQLGQTWVYPFNGNGIHDVNNLPNYPVTENDFKKSVQETSVDVTSAQFLRKEIRTKPSNNAIIEIKNGNIQYARIMDRDNNFAGDAKVDLVDDGKLLIYEGNSVLVYFKDKVQDARITIRNIESPPYSTDQTWNLRIKFFDSSEKIGTPSEQLSVYNGATVEAVVPIKVRIARDLPAGTARCGVGKITTPCVCELSANPVLCPADWYCNNRQGAMKCEKEAFVQGDAPPRIVKVEYRTGNVWYDLEAGPKVELAGAQLNLRLTVEDDGEIVQLRWTESKDGGVPGVGIDSNPPRLINGQKVYLSDFTYANVAATYELNLYIKDNKGQESSPKTLTVEKAITQP
jgi:hypothetical protein